MWSPKWSFINERIPATFCGTALDIYFCNLWSAEGGMELGNSAVAATVWHMTVSVHWIYDVKFQPWSWTPSPPLLWKLIHMNSWLIIKGRAISIQSPSRGCHGSEGRNLLRATGEPNWICGVSVYECVSTSSVHQNTMCWKAAGKSSCTYDGPGAGLGGSMQASKPRQ